VELPPDVVTTGGSMLATFGAVVGIAWRNRSRIAKFLEANSPQVEGLTAAVGALNDSLEVVSSRLSRVELDNDELRRRLSDTEDELREVRRQRDSQRERIAELESQVEALRSELAAREAKAPKTTVRKSSSRKPSQES
jgi:chromosome segregation ATPase